jgi:hypothetical protein
VVVSLRSLRLSFAGATFDFDGDLLSFDFDGDFSRYLLLGERGHLSSLDTRVLVTGLIATGQRTL